jgi:hypothetical protein
MEENIQQCCEEQDIYLLDILAEKYLGIHNLSSKTKLIKQLIRRKRVSSKISKK